MSVTMSSQMYDPVTFAASDQGAVTAANTSSDLAAAKGNQRCYYRAIHIAERSYCNQWELHSFRQEAAHCSRAAGGPEQAVRAYLGVPP